MHRKEMVVYNLLFDTPRINSYFDRNVQAFGRGNKQVWQRKQQLIYLRLSPKNLARMLLTSKVFSIVFGAIPNWSTIRGAHISANSWVMAPNRRETGETRLSQQQTETPTQSRGQIPHWPQLPPPRNATQHLLLTTKLTSKLCPSGAPRSRSSKTWRQVSPFRQRLHKDVYR